VILDPSGTPLEGGKPFLGNEKTGVFSLKAYRLPVYGTYLLRFSGANGSGGATTYSATTAAAKFKKGIPVADAGAAFGAEPDLSAQLDGTKSTAGVVYRWSQVAGPTVTLS